MVASVVFIVGSVILAAAPEEGTILAGRLVVGAAIGKASKQVGEMKRNEIQPFLMSRIMIPIRLCSLPIHSPGICMLGPIE